jgi:hypothetical protein
MNIDVLQQVTDQRLDEAWRVYDGVFCGIEAMTVRRDPMDRPAFEGVMRDRRVDKWLVRADDGRLLGLAAYASDLRAWPHASPEYFAQRWPRQYLAQKIWYFGFVAVPDRRRDAFVELVEAMCRRAEEQHGVVSFDLCRHTIESYRLDPVVAAWMHRISRGQVRCETAGAQTFPLYEAA